MADDNSSDQEKTEEPSQYRVEEFRKRGEVASSKELTSVLILSASILTLALSIVYIHEVMDEFVRWIYALDFETAFTEKSLNTILTNALYVSLKAVAPLFLVVFCVGVLSHVMQFGLLFSPDILEFKLERIDPLQGIKRLFSIRSVVEAIKGIFKFIFILGIVYAISKDDLNSWNGFLHMDFVESFVYGKELIIKLGFSIIGGLLIIAIGDFIYQKMSYRKKLMMTKEEAKREHREKDFNPEVKQRIRTIQREMANRRMMADVPKADVIVTNPTHISVAIKYDETMVSPVVIAKGADHLALRIRTLAKEHNIPIVENVALARTMYKTIKIGQGVPRSLYKAVAEILAFVYKMKKKSKAIMSNG